MNVGLINLGNLVSDPSTPPNGSIWYNSTLGKFRKMENGIVSDLNSGSLTVTEIEIDFGTTPVRAKRFTITDALVTGSTKKILVNPSGNVATGRGSDDWEWDSIQFAAKANTGNFTLYANASGKILGKRKIFYTIN